jgi:hypothetical protein
MRAPEMRSGRREKFMKNRIPTIMFTLAAGGLFAGCSGAPEAESGVTEVDSRPADVSTNVAKLRAERTEKERLDEVAGLTYTIEVRKDHIVRFTMPKDGNNAVIISERMPIYDTSVLTKFDGFTVGDIVKTLQPDAPVPERLQPFLDVRAIDNGEVSGVVGQVDPVTDVVGLRDVAAPSLNEQHITNSGTHYRDDHRFCPTSMNYGGQTIAAINTSCDLNMVTDSHSVNATHSGVVVGTYRGSTTVSAFYNGSFQWSFTVLEGEMNWSGMMSGLTRSCTLWSCGDWRVAVKAHKWSTDSSMSGGAHHYGAVWVNRSSATRGPMTPIFG